MWLPHINSKEPHIFSELPLAPSDADNLLKEYYQSKRNYFRNCGKLRLIHLIEDFIP